MEGLVKIVVREVRLSTETGMEGVSQVVVYGQREILCTSTGHETCFGNERTNRSRRSRVGVSDVR